MAARALFVRYNRMTYRWEVCHHESKLPLFTNPSKDAAMLQAISLLGDTSKSEITVYNEDDLLESVMEIKMAPTSSSARNGLNLKSRG